MERRGKVRRILTSSDLVDAVFEVSLEDGVKVAVLKDAHLVQAAIQTDQRISSLDDKARNHFANLVAAIQPLGSILWVNPTHEVEGAISWLANGLPDEVWRRLSNVLRS